MSSKILRPKFTFSFFWYFSVCKISGAPDPLQIISNSAATLRKTATCGPLRQNTRNLKVRIIKKNKKKITPLEILLHKFQNSLKILTPLAVEGKN